MASIVKVKNGYRARWRTPDGGSRCKTFDLERDARKWLTSVEKAKDDGVYVDRKAGAVTVGEYAGQWVATRRTRDGAPLRPRTKALYAQLLDKHIVPTLGAKPLRDVRPDAVRAWHASLPGTVAPAKCYRLLRAIFATAVDEGLMVRNPCMVKNAAVERSPERPLPTGDEVWQLADAVPTRYRALVLTAAFAGLRFGELAGLQRGDIDSAARVVTVRRAVVEVDGGLEVGPPKTAAGVRAVALPPALAVALEQHLDAYVADDLRAPVFAGPKGGLLRRANFAPMWARAGRSIGRDDLHLHDCRHFAATLAASAGASTAELMARLGHASPAAALRYQHATGERDRVIAERMGDLVPAREEVALRVVGGQG